MRLPCDAALVVVDMQQAIDDPQWGRRNNPGAEAAVASLIAAWRAEKLPLVHVRRDSLEPNSPFAPGKAGHAFKACALPIEGERIVGRGASSAFVGAGLEDELDALGVTTLVICGALTPNAVEATARHAGDLGYRVFVVADACFAVDKRDARGRLWAAEDAHALSLANLSGEYAEIVDCAQTLQASALANARQRARGSRGR